MERSAIVKIFGLLEVLGTHESPVALGDLARSCRLPKPTVHRVLRQLCEMGYVDHTTEGRYHLTSKLRYLSSPPVERLLLSASDSSLEELHRELDETVNLAILRNGGVIYLRVLETTQGLRKVVEANTIDPFYCTALGRAMVAYLPEETVNGLFAQEPELKKLTAETVTDPVRLREIFDDVRRLGYAVERDETDIGVTCVGAPIFQHENVVGAVSLSAPSARLRGGLENRAIRGVKQAATTITARLSG